MVEVRPHHDHRIGRSRQFTNNVRLLQSFDGLLDQLVFSASLLLEESLERGLSLAVVSLVALQSRFNNIAIHRAELQLCRRRSQEHADGWNEEQTRPAERL